MISGNVVHLTYCVSAIFHNELEIEDELSEAQTFSEIAQEQQESGGWASYMLLLMSWNCFLCTLNDELPTDRYNVEHH